MNKFLLATTCLLSPAMVLAQTPTSNAQSASPAGEATGLTEIIVTASRRAESVERAALSIQAISAEEMSRKGIVRPEDLSSIAPSVSVSTVAGFPQTYIRGVGNYAATIYAEGAVAYNLDGIYVSRGWATRGVFFDLDRVEILKGPQGTLYGRNASGGAVNVITKRPSLDVTEGFVEIEAGDYDLVRATSAVNLPLGSTMAVRASGQFVDRDGYLSDGYDDDKSHSARVHLLWEASPDFSALLTGNYQHIGGMGTGQVVVPSLPGNRWRGGSDPAVVNIVTSEPGIGGLLTYPKNDGYIDADIYSASGEFTWNLGEASLTILPAYRDGTIRFLNYGGGFSDLHKEQDKQTSLEARLGGDTGSLKWVLGGYFFDEKTSNPNGELQTLVLQGVNAQTIGPLEATVRSYAGFGQGTYSLTDTLRLTGGLRYTYEEKIQSGSTSAYTFPNAAPPPACAGNFIFDPKTVQVPLFCRLDVPLTGRLVYRNWTWKGGVEFDVAPRSMAYANVSTGFKSGGFIFAPPPNTFKPEKLTAFEAGIKNRFLDNTLQLNLEGFYWRYLDHQESHVGPTSVPGFFSFITENAGKAKSYGLEVDIKYLPTPADQLGLMVQYNKTKYDSFTYQHPAGVFGPPATGCQAGVVSPSGNQSIDCSGFQLIRSPVWSGTASYDHTFTLASGDTITAGASGKYASGTYLAIDFLPAEYQRAYTLFDADVSYTTHTGRIAVTAYVRNLTNEFVVNQTFRYPFVSAANPEADPQGLILAAAGAPRTFGVRARYNF